MKKEPLLELRDHLRKYNLDVSRFSSGNSLTARLKLLIEHRQIDYVIDVGANEGQFGESLRNIGYDGPILSFEPAADPFAALKVKAAADGNWQVNQLALGSADEEGTLNVANHGVFNSFHPASEYGSATFHDVVFDHLETVSVRRLDRFLTSLPMERRPKNIFLKMDTQGHDLEVFRGATKILPHVALLQMELSVHRIYDGTPGWQEVVAEMETADFGLAGLFPVTIDTFFEVIEFDGLFVNRSNRPSN